MNDAIPPVWELSARFRERQAQPITIDGQRYLCTVEASAIVGCKPDWLRKLAARHAGDGLHTTPQGYVFIRRPRQKKDQKAPIYWREDTLR